MFFCSFFIGGLARGSENSSLGPRLALSRNYHRRRAIEGHRKHMSKFTLGLIILAGLALGVGFVFLQTWNIPAPTEQVERTLDDDRFPR